MNIKTPAVGEVKEKEVQWGAVGAAAVAAVVKGGLGAAAAEPCAAAEVGKKEVGTAATEPCAAAEVKEKEAGTAATEPRAAAEVKEKELQVLPCLVADVRKKEGKVEVCTVAAAAAVKEDSCAAAELTGARGQPDVQQLSFQVWLWQGRTNTPREDHPLCAIFAVRRSNRSNKWVGETVFHEIFDHGWSSLGVCAPLSLPPCR